jgi:imidazolonepropionase-like amidohydrolase
MFRSKAVLAVFALLMPSLLCAETVLIGPVNVVSMTSGGLRENRTVIIEDGVITGMIRYDVGLFDIDDGSTVIDGRGGFLIPGLAEMHAHIPSHQQGEQKARDVLALYLAHGVTTARGMLGEAWHLQLRESLAAQEWFGPRLITSGPSFNGRSVTSPEQAAARVREQSAAGYDFLKLHPGLKADEYEAIADTAHELGIPFAGHVSFDVGLDATFRQGQATIDHLDGYAEALVPDASPMHGVEPAFFGLNLASEMDPSGAAQLASATAAAGVWNVPTQSLLESMAGDRSLDELLARPGMRFASSGLSTRWAERVKGAHDQMTPEERRRFIETRRKLILELQEAGAGLLLGSDAPQIMNIPGVSVHDELEYLVQAGLTPLQALQSGTVNVARFFGEPDRGDTSSGQVADLILLEHNPLEDIGATRTILGVMRGGTWYGRKDLDERLQAIEKRGL